MSAKQKKFVVKRTIPATIPVFVDEEEFELRVKVRRFTDEERSAFLGRFKQLAAPPSSRLIERRDDERATNDAGEFLLSSIVIEMRRRSEMSEDDRHVYDEMVDQEEAATMAWNREVLTTYLTVESGQMDYEISDGELRDVRTGEDFYEAFSNSLVIIQGAMTVVHYENVMTPGQKKVWRLQRGSERSSRPSDAAPTGTAPATTAGGAKTKGSARSGTVPAATRTTLSGTPVH